MKKSLLLTVFLFFIAASVCFAGSSGNFTGGKALVGLGGNLNLDGADPDIFLNTDLGFFAFDNFLLQAGTNMRIQADNFRLLVSSGFQYYLSGFFITPFLGTEFSYLAVDDFNGDEDTMLIRLTLGADLFIVDGFSFVFTGYPVGVWFYDGDSDFIDGFAYSLGFHLFL